VLVRAAGTDVRDGLPAYASWMHHGHGSFAAAPVPDEALGGLRAGEWDPFEQAQTPSHPAFLDQHDQQVT
jgi:hypothetical protein